MLLVIDNYDSFTYNLVQYFGELRADVKVFRNDAITVEEISELKPDHICLSPGPGTPETAGVSNKILEVGPTDVPVLGVCLGHQCIGRIFGASVVRAERMMHGKTSQVYHQGKSVFKGLVSPFEATRYHSLIVKPETLPDCLEVTAETAEGEIMGLMHKSRPIHGVQFHPESILTHEGRALLANFLAM